MSFEPVRLNASWTYDLLIPAGDGGFLTRARTVSCVFEVPWTIQVHDDGQNPDTFFTVEERERALVVTNDYQWAHIGATFDDRVYEPFRLRLQTSPAATRTNATYCETFTQTLRNRMTLPMTSSKTVMWKVIDEAEPVTVPAGTFTALHVRRRLVGAPSPSEPTSPLLGESEYWFVRGVGKVKELEVATGRVEVLRAYVP